jgi:ADP-ribose pyrophosphatase YjhB (NUDIX family)
MSNINNLSLPKKYYTLIKHITVTGYTVNSDKTKVLLIYHKKLNKWMPPGGHIQDGEMPHEAILREVKEETGINTKFLWKKMHVNLDKNREWLIPSPHLVMLQLIPKNNKETEHYHYDLSYMLLAKNEKIKVNLKEVEKAGWFSLKEIMALNTFPIVPEICKSILRE